ncbi:MAG: hypothetical protein QMD86_02620, partial [Patescibacteria group bacterium]|nr:hypothetical protein [Patescibacteria group bacterium]
MQNLYKNRLFILFLILLIIIFPVRFAQAGGVFKSISLVIAVVVAFAINLIPGIGQIISVGIINGLGTALLMGSMAVVGENPDSACENLPAGTQTYSPCKPDTLLCAEDSCAFLNPNGNYAKIDTRGKSIFGSADQCVKITRTESVEQTTINETGNQVAIYRLTQSNSMSLQDFSMWFLMSLWWSSGNGYVNVTNGNYHSRYRREPLRPPEAGMKKHL